MRRMRLKTILTLIFAFMVALTVLLVSIFSGTFINRQFEEYVKESQQKEALELAESIGSNYEEAQGGFNIDYVHGMGMYALTCVHVGEHTRVSGALSPEDARVSPCLVCKPGLHALRGAMPERPERKTQEAKALPGPQFPLLEKDGGGLGNLPGPHN